MTEPIMLPILRIGDELWPDAMLYTNRERQFEMVRKAFQPYGLLEPPDQSEWLSSPLSLWCWFVIWLNELEPMPDQMTSRPLIDWSIDLQFASSDVQRFIWIIA